MFSPGTRLAIENGYSHRPGESASAEDIARGALVLAETLAGLAA
jgi:hypothetical protein